MTLNKGDGKMLVLVNDQIKRREDVRIDLEDRGYQFGDGIYEVISVYNGQPFLMDQHMQRLERSARELMLDLPVSIGRLKEKVQALIEQEGRSTCSVYLQVTRGAAPRRHPFPTSATPVLTGYIVDGRPPRDLHAEGIRAITTDDIRWLRCDIKSLNLLGSVLAKQKAVEQGCQEAILHRSDTVTEGSSTNVFIVKNGTLCTHPANHLILHGITRHAAIQLAEKLNMNVKETPFKREELYEADEVFVTGTSIEICPVTHVDNRAIGNGQPGDVTKQLQQAFYDLIAEETAMKAE
jgi:D-alanine transaminase